MIKEKIEYLKLDAEEVEKLEAILDRYNNMIGVTQNPSFRDKDDDPDDEWDEFAYELWDFITDDKREVM